MRVARRYNVLMILTLSLMLTDCVSVQAFFWPGWPGSSPPPALPPSGPPSASPPIAPFTPMVNENTIPVPMPPGFVERNPPNNVPPAQPPIDVPIIDPPPPSIPEPATLVSGLIAVGMIAIRRWRRNQSANA